jgi:Trk-type K+ transport system membrane component
MFGIIFVGSLIVTGYGFKPIDAAFETTSAIATAGLSVGIVGPTLALPLKWLFMFLMILGRVEIIPFLIMFSRTKERHPPRNNCHNHKRNHNSSPEKSPKPNNPPETVPSSE